MLAPSRPERPTQIIDVRDLAEWTLRMVEAGQIGIYNATGPDYVLTMGQLLETCKTVSSSDANFVWVGDEFLVEQGVTPWTEIPLWVPEEEETIGFSAADCGKAIATGLTFRPLADTVRDTLAWDATRPPDVEWRAGLKSERELELLQAWEEA